jgi:hypothetical protein
VRVTSQRRKQPVFPEFHSVRFRVSPRLRQSYFVKHYRAQSAGECMARCAVLDMSEGSFGRTASLKVGSPQPSWCSRIADLGREKAKKHRPASRRTPMPDRFRNSSFAIPRLAQNQCVLAPAATWPTRYKTLRGMVRSTALTLFSLGMLGGCVTHTFAPGPGMSELAFEPDSARCRLFARGSASGFDFSAAGSPRFVGAAMGGAAVGYAIGSAVERNQNFNDCMLAHGWRIADGQPTPDPAMGGKLASAEQPRRLSTDLPVSAAMTGQFPNAVPNTAVPVPRTPCLIRGAVVTPDMADAVHLVPPHGVIILSVGAGGTETAAGLQERDVIIDFNGTPVNSESDMQRAIGAINLNSTVVTTIWRDDAKTSIEVHF